MSENANTSSSAHTTVNSQIADAVSQLNAITGESLPIVFSAAVYQSVAASLSLALQNAVLMQQHQQMLHMAFTTAAAEAILHGDESQAKQILDLAEAKLKTPGLTNTVQEIKTCMETIREELEKFRQQSTSV